MRYLDIILIFSCFCFISCQKMPVNYDNNNTDIIAFGDSLTYSQGASRTETYPYFLGEIVNKEIINLGISGNTSADGVNRLSELDDYKPYMVLVEFSANDMFRKVPTKITEDNLIKIVKEIQKRGAIVVLVDTGGHIQMSPYTKIQKRIAKEYNTLFVSGIMDGIYNKSSLKSDEIHPNSKGYKLVAEKVAKVIKPYIK